MMEEVPMNVDTTKDEGWQLAGKSAEAYERYLVPALFTASAERLLDLAGVKEGDRVLDVACGTGIVARRAVPRAGAAGKVVGLDLNGDMLEVARTASAGTRPAIEWRQGNAAELPFPDGVFDIVLCQQALQFFTDRPKAFREMHRVLAPQGRLALSVCRPIEYSPAYPPLAAALERHVGAEAGAMMRSPFLSWGREQLRTALREAGFQDVRVRISVAEVRYPSPEELVRQEAASSPLAGPLSALSPDVRAGLLRDVSAALRERVDDDGVVSPLETFVVAARR
jgi:ubiquinone/menaquinone biosynthesis C-methylase UbiE